VDFKRSVIPQGEFKSKLVQATATKTIPDLILLDNPDNQALAAQGTVADITDKVKTWPYKYFPGPWSSTLYNGRNYGLPLFSNTLGVWYNQTLLQKAGLNALPVSLGRLPDGGQKTHLERGLRSLLIRRPQRSWHLYPITLSLVCRDRSNAILCPGFGDYG
jgi:multiple sugar transport system substrate-binding protein